MKTGLSAKASEIMCFPTGSSVPFPPSIRRHLGKRQSGTESGNARFATNSNFISSPWRSRPLLFSGCRAPPSSGPGRGAAALSPATRVSSPHDRETPILNPLPAHAPTCAARSRVGPDRGPPAIPIPAFPHELHCFQLELAAELPSLHLHPLVPKTPYLGVHETGSSSEIDNASARLMTVYELDGPTTSRSMRDRCLAYLDGVNSEIDIRSMWPSHEARLRCEGLA